MLIKTNGIFHLAAPRFGADAGNGLHGAGELIHQFHRLAGALDAVFIAQIQFIGELLAHGEHLLGRIKLARLGIAVRWLVKPKSST